MFWFKRNPVFYLFLGALMALAVFGMLYTSQDAKRLDELKTEYANKNQQLQLFLKRSPAPTKANLATLDRNYDLLKGEFEKAQVALNLSTYDKDMFFGKRPGNSNDAFFMIAKYVEDARRLAASSEVKTVEGSRYGFSQYENVGPVEEAIERVHKQAKIMEALLQALFDSGISEFVSIKREASVVPEPSDEPQRSVEGDEIFSIDSTSEFKRTDSLESLAFRVEFKGQSLSMRSFLNRITGSSLPFSIHEIEVALDKEAGSAEERSSILDNPFNSEENSPSQISAMRVPIISENESRFIITVEFLELKEGPLVSLDDETEGGNV